MKNSLVSICIPTFNGEKYLKECLDSVLSQTYSNIEIIIVDDKSSDKTVPIIKEYLQKDSRIKLYENEINFGLVGNWNKCIEIAKGDWIKFIFQDDYVTADCIEKMIGASDNSNAIIACKRNFVLNNFATLQEKEYYTTEVVTFEKLGIKQGTTHIDAKEISNMAANNICLNFIGEPTSLLFKKSVVEQLGYFNNNLFQICDLEFFLRIASNYGVIYISESLTFFRIHSDSTTNTNISNNNYVLAHLDPIINVCLQLYDASYSNFRKCLTPFNKKKLNNYFSVRVYEAYKTAKRNRVDSFELKKFNVVAKHFPEINRYKHPSLTTLVLLKIVEWRRKWRLAKTIF